MTKSEIQEMIKAHNAEADLGLAAIDIASALAKGEIPEDELDKLAARHFPNTNKRKSRNIVTDGYLKLAQTSWTQATNATLFTQLELERPTRQHIRALFGLYADFGQYTDQMPVDIATVRQKYIDQLKKQFKTAFDFLEGLAPPPPKGQQYYYQSLFDDFEAVAKADHTKAMHTTHTYQDALSVVATSVNHSSSGYFKMMQSTRHENEIRMAYDWLLYKAAQAQRGLNNTPFDDATWKKKLKITGRKAAKDLKTYFKHYASENVSTLEYLEHLLAKAEDPTFDHDHSLVVTSPRPC